jgi:hypothetical protein
LDLRKGIASTLGVCERNVLLALGKCEGMGESCLWEWIGRLCLDLGIKALVTSLFSLSLVLAYRILLYYYWQDRNLNLLYRLID